jgi:hypothetical protein
MITIIFIALYEICLKIKAEKLAYFFFVKTIKQTELVTPVIHIKNRPTLIVKYDSGDWCSNEIVIKPSRNILDIN